MIRLGGVLALLASLGLAGLLSMQVHRLGFDEQVDTFDDHACSFRGRGFWFESEDDTYLMMTPPPLPPTFPSRFLEFRIEGTKGDSDLIGILHLPKDLRGRAVAGASIEIRHEWLELPLIGHVAGRTRVTVGGVEWQDGPWRLRGAIAAIALLPLVAWAILSLPFLLLRKRPAPQA